MWLDSHAHLTAPEYDADRAEVLERAKQAGVDTILTIGAGYGLEDLVRAPELAEQYPQIFATVGIHPHNAALLDDAGRSLLREQLQKPKVVAIGECGLDYHYMNSPREAQRAVFAEQVALAKELDLPVCIHVRSDGPEAYDELLEIWLAEGGGEIEGLLHCYTGSVDFAQKAVGHGFHVSFSGILTFKKADELREAAQRLPLDRILIETDAPFLAPQGFRGKRNEPAHVSVVGEALAATRKQDIEEVAAATTANAKRFFRLPN